MKYNTKKKRKKKKKENKTKSERERERDTNDFYFECSHSQWRSQEFRSRRARLKYKIGNKKLILKKLININNKISKQR